MPGDSSGENAFSMVGWNPVGFRRSGYGQLFLPGQKLFQGGFDRSGKRLGRAVSKDREKDYQLGDVK